MKPKTPRKSVTFVASSDENVAELEPEKSVIPQIRKSLLILPVQLPLVLYGMFHQGLTEDPLFTMVKGLFTLVWVQLAYGYLLASVFTSDKAKKKNSPIDTMNLVISATVVACVLANAIFVILILFGSPLYVHVRETYVLSYHLALILVQPILVIYRLRFDDIAALFRTDHLYSATLSNTTLSSSAVGILGTWLGVIPIPLDWDRPWQQWPITLLVGGYCGAFAGSALSLVVC